MDTMNVYWTSPGTAENDFTDGLVMQCPIGGGMATTIASQQVMPESVAVDGTNIYWVNGQSVMEKPLAGGTAIALASPHVPINAIALGATDVYFTDGAAPGAVMSVPIGGGALRTLITSSAAPTAIATNASGIYWAGAADGHAETFALPFGDTTPTELVGAAGAVFLSIAVDEASVYWTGVFGSGQMGQVSSAPLSPTPNMSPQTLANDQGLDTSSYVGLAVDATSLYWAANNAVYRLTPK